MPIVTVTTWPNQTEKQCKTLIEALTGTVQHVTGCPLDKITVYIHEVPQSHWGEGGALGSDPDFARLSRRTSIDAGREDAGRSPETPASGGERETTATHTTSARYDDGLSILQKIAGVERPAVLDSLAQIAPDLGRYTVEFAYGDLYARHGLTLRQRQLATIAGLVALGYAAPQLRFHVEGALNVGCSRREIVETIIHLCVYAGFPATLNAMTVAGEVFSAHQTAPESEDDRSVDESPAGDRYERGWAALAEIDGEAGEKVIASLQHIAPDLARYIVEFSFGDIYCRSGLDLKTREIVTIAACTAMGTASAQLRVHVHGLLNVGGSQLELVETIIQMAVYAGFPAALNAITVAREALGEREDTHTGRDVR